MEVSMFIILEYVNNYGKNRYLKNFGKQLYTPAYWPLYIVSPTDLSLYTPAD